MPSPLAHCVAAVDYGYPWEQVLHQFKYQQGHAWAHAMADWLLQHPDGPPLLRAADAILPVPLAPARLRERGYNQAWELTCALTRACGVRRKAHARWLSRRDTSRHQVGSSRVQRLRNLRDAFACHVQVRGQHILLVDDVMTTGATLFTLARLLQARGAASVTAMAFARTPLPGLS
ncbi:ComF family protein [Lampropedia cohaerens]|nr:phosphoribosyltransferase family protein [Lampropedia cohaerens]